MEYPDIDCITKIPYSMENEVFVLYYTSATFKANVDGNIRNCKGLLYLSNLRIVFVSEDYSIDLPLATMENEQFHQPLFGANYLSGKNPPIEKSNIANIVEWKIIFENGIGSFLNCFLTYLDSMRKNIEISSINITAFIDASDPSIILIPQDI